MNTQMVIAQEWTSFFGKLAQRYTRVLARSDLNLPSMSRSIVQEASSKKKVQEVKLKHPLGEILERFFLGVLNEHSH